MRPRKRGIAHRLLALLTVITVLAGFPAYAGAGVLHEEKSVQTVTSGVTYEEITRMYDSGWVNLYVLRVDLTNPNVKLDVLESATEFGLKEPVSQMAQANGAVAAVNGDFFASTTLSTSMGIVIRDGRLEQARNYYNASPSYAGLYIDTQNRPYIDYLKISYIGVLTNGTSKIEIDAKNKVTDMKKPVYIDRSAMTDTAKLDARFKDLYKIVVDGGRIVDISAGGAVKTVPANGFIVVMDYKTAVDHLSKFSIGDEAKFTEGSQFIGNPSLSAGNVKLGFSGGGKIIENGQYRDGGLILEPEKRHPRTAAGINQSGTELIIAAIDGRSKNSIGATHYETYEIMKGLGCRDAFHLDGGGSTTLLSREEGRTDLTLQNTPSDGTERKVANAVGISSVNAPGALEGLYVMADGNKGSAEAFESYPVRISVMGYDANFNPVQIQGAELSQSGAGGKLSGSLFTPSSAGETEITAEVGGFKGSVIIKARSKPSLIKITPEAFRADIGETIEIKAEIVNLDGYGFDITGSSTLWGVSENIGFFEAPGKFKATADGAGTVTVSYNGLVGTASAAVGSYTKSLVDFETAGDVMYLMDGTGAPGNVTFSNTIRHEGNNSLQINYAFKAPNQTATVDFRNMDALITEKPNAFGFWLTGDAAGSAVSAVFIDGDGNEQIFGFPTKMDNGDWKYYYGRFGEDIPLPLKLSRINITSAANLKNPVNGKVYLDTFRVSYSYRPDTSAALSEFYGDYMRAELKTAPQHGETEIAIFGPTANSDSGFHTALFDRVIAKMQQNSSLAVFAGYNSDIPQMLTETLKWSDTYSVKDTENARIITLATGKSGMRATNPAQWLRFISDLNNSPHKNAIIVLNKDIWDSEYGFSDSLERDLLHKTLAQYGERTGANVLVAAGISDSPKAYISDGVRYVTVNGLVSGSRSPEDYRILRVRVSENSMSYDLESLE